MTTLVVEDKPARRLWFRRTIKGPLDLTADVDQAITWLGEGRPYTALWLDHDLGTEPRAGREVALWLIAHPDVLPDLQTWVHSHNRVSGPKIERELRAAGRPATWVPFNALVAAGA